jgi:hypothetical protein
MLFMNVVHEDYGAWIAQSLQGLGYGFDDKEIVV